MYLFGVNVRLLMDNDWFDGNVSFVFVNNNFLCNILWLFNVSLDLLINVWFAIESFNFFVNVLVNFLPDFSSDVNNISPDVLLNFLPFWCDNNTPRVSLDVILLFLDDNVDNIVPNECDECDFVFVVKFQCVDCDFWLIASSIFNVSSRVSSSNIALNFVSDGTA